MGAACTHPPPLPRHALYLLLLRQWPRRESSSTRSTKPVHRTRGPGRSAPPIHQSRKAFPCSSPRRTALLPPLLDHVHNLQDGHASASIDTMSIGIDSKQREPELQANHHSPFGERNRRLGPAARHPPELLRRHGLRRLRKPLLVVRPNKSHPGKVESMSS